MTKQILMCPVARRDFLRSKMLSAATRESSTTRRNVAVGETHVFSTASVNQFSFGYNRIFDYITSQGTGTCESAKLGIPGANVGCANGTTCAGSSCGLTSTTDDRRRVLVTR